MSLKQKLGQIPKSPGVYFFLDKKGDIIYIGKAKILRNRVRSYFNKPKGKDAKTQVMVKNITDIEWLVSASEVEALLTEANLIKEHRPRYNVFLKDDKTFPYIRITNEPFPRVEIIRQKNLTRDDHNYFGPYTDAGHLREILRVIHKIFPLRTCTYLINDASIKEGKINVCLDYHIKRCDGPCEGIVSEKEYGNMIVQIKRFLKGRNEEIRNFLNQQMECASKGQNYEDAARYRDQLRTVMEFTKKQKKASQDFKDRDVIALSAENSYGVGVVMRIRNGHIMGREKFILKVHDADAESQNLSQFFLQYYSSTIDIPEEVLLECTFDEIVEYENWLTGIRKKRVKILLPGRGEKRKLVEVSRRNADLLLGELRLKQARRKELLTKPILQLQEDLGMEIPPRRIEAFDNSNIQGSNPVAGMVCFVLPQFAQIFEDADVALPTLTRVLLSATDAVGAYLFLWLPLVVVTGVGLVGYFRTERGRRLWHSTQLNAVLLRGVMRSLLIGRTFRLLGMMVQSGVPLLEGVRLTRRSIQNLLYRDLFQKLENDILNGRKLGQSLVEAGFVPPTAAEMVITAEKTGTMGVVTQSFERRPLYILVLRTIHVC